MSGKTTYILAMVVILALLVAGCTVLDTSGGTTSDGNTTASQTNGTPGTGDCLTPGAEEMSQGTSGVGGRAGYRGTPEREDVESMTTGTIPSEQEQDERLDRVNLGGPEAPADASSTEGPAPGTESTLQGRGTMTPTLTTVPCP